jgi:4-hydroxybenzoate polyprenyltransferase
VKPAALFVRMLRWRVAVTLWFFLLIGAAAQGPLRPSIALLLAAAALSASYVVATTVNDIADQDVDRINHPRDRDRPLPPVRLSYRTWLAPTVLAVAYAVVPYALGLLAAGGAPDGLDATLCVALYFLFLARINLKDFRDRPGDAAYGKPTLLIVHGKSVTCAVTGLTLFAGCVALVVALDGGLGVVTIVSVFAGTILWMLWRLWRASDPRDEQLAIGLGAKMGNGLLASTLAWLVLDADGAPEGVRVLVLAFLAVVYVSVLIRLHTRADQIEIAYKG